MKILFVISHLTDDGPVNALQAIIKGFHDLGKHEIVVLTLKAPHKNTLRSAFTHLGVRVENFPVNLLWPFVKIFQIRHFLVSEHFDAAVSICFRADAMLGLASLGVAHQRIFTTVENIPSDDLGFLFPGWRGRLAAWLHYQVLRLFGNHIICVSHTIRDHLQERIGASGVCVRNPVVAQLHSPEVDRSEPVIVYAASLSARKNPGEAIDFVLHSLVGRSYKYKIYGKGPLEARLRESYQSEEQISWHGFSDNLSHVFARASVYVSSSLSEGLPLTPQHALICGCPCVLSDIPQHRELAALSSFVYLYRAGDQGDFARAINLALSADILQACQDGQRLAELVSPRLIACELYNIFNSI